MCQKLPVRRILAAKYGAQDFFNERVRTSKKNTYYNGVFELYNPFTIIEK